jgi:hypothetical protein
MSFTSRVVRQRKEAGLLKPDVQVQQPMEGAALAASHIELGWEVEEKILAWPRASSLYSECMRRLVIGSTLGRTRQEHLSVKDRMMFGIGNALHYWLQNTGDILGDRRRGWWKCTACRNVLYFGGPPKTKCTKCGAYPEAIIYFEHPMRLTEPYKVTGHPDMFLEPEPNIFRVTEIKSLGGEDFDKLNAPLVEHENQLQTYMWGLPQDDRFPIVIDDSLGYMFYICKRHRVKDLPMKMFPVPRNDAMILRIKAKLELYKKGMEDYPNDLPPVAEACLRGGRNNYQARTCVVREECFRFYENEE